MVQTTLDRKQTEQTRFEGEKRKQGSREFSCREGKEVGCDGGKLGKSERDNEVGGEKIK